MSPELSQGDRIIRTSAPVRLDFAGAWTDVAPFCFDARGAVVNAAIELRTHVELRLGRDRYELCAVDLNEGFNCATLGEMRTDGHLDLLKAALRWSGLGPCALRTWATAPPGSGLGSSGSLGVALVHAMAAAHGHQPGSVECAEQAWRLETVGAAIAGGRQDQYAAAFGGFQHLTFDRGATTTDPLGISSDFAAELAAHTLICYTGHSRFSGNVITRVMAAYSAHDPEVVGALHELGDIADRMAGAFMQEDLIAVARLLTANWREQQRLDDGMCTPEMVRLETAMTAAGAAGGKAAGAGAGGSMFFIVPGNVDGALAAARACGAAVLPVSWSNSGVRTEASIDSPPH